MATKNRQQQSLAASLGKNIMTTCSCLSSAVREYYQLPEADQRQVWDDLTGVDVGVECHVSGRIDDKSLVAAWKDKYEPREMVEEALQKMAAELERMPTSHKKDALELALQQNGMYVNAKAFRLKFLRAEKFDVFAAAVRLCRHFEEKLLLFGEEALTREISIEDIIANEDDKDALYRGYLQVLKDTDQGNRPILFYFKAITNCNRKRENALRVFWYVANRLSQNERVQILGISNLVYNNGGFPKNGMDYEKSRRFSRLFLSVPVRFNTFYVCLDDSPWLTVVETFAVMTTRFLRIRLRMIRGTRKEVVEKLKSVGIPLETLPVNEKSELQMGYHKKWIKKQLKLEGKDKKLRTKDEKEKEQREQVPELNERAEDSKKLYKMNMNDIAKLMDTTASFYGRGSIDSAPAQFFHAVG